MAGVPERRQLSEAIGELSTAVSLDPKLAEAHSCGVAYDQKGLHDRAQESYVKRPSSRPGRCAGA